MLSTRAAFEEQGTKYTYIRKRSDILPIDYYIEASPLAYRCRINTFLWFFWPKNFDFEYYNVAKYSEAIQSNDEAKKLINEYCAKETKQCDAILKQERDESEGEIPTISLLTVTKWCGGFIVIAYGFYATVASLRSGSVLEHPKISSLSKDILSSINSTPSQQHAL